MQISLEGSHIRLRWNKPTEVKRMKVGAMLCLSVAIAVGAYAIQDYSTNARNLSVAQYRLFCALFGSPDERLWGTRANRGRVRNNGIRARDGLVCSVHAGKRPGANQELIEGTPTAVRRESRISRKAVGENGSSLKQREDGLA